VPSALPFGLLCFGLPNLVLQIYEKLAARVNTKSAPTGAGPRVLAQGEGKDKMEKVNS
jgi:hypothetical protein